jgi:hypothetical protein
MKELLKLVVLVVLVVAIAYCGATTYAECFDKYRANFSAENTKTGDILIAYLIISAFRKLLPPLYYMLPLGSLLITVLADRLGSDVGALVYQALKLQDLMYFLLLRRIYSNAADRIFEEGGEPPQICWMPECARSVLCAFDRVWGDKLWSSKSKCCRFVVHAATVVAFNVALGVEDYVALFWVASR